MIAFFTFAGLLIALFIGCHELTKNSCYPREAPLYHTVRIIIIVAIAAKVIQLCLVVTGIKKHASLTLFEFILGNLDELGFMYICAVKILTLNF